MSASYIQTLLAIGALLAVASLLLRIFSGGKYEIKTTDLVFIVIPLVVMAISTGKLKGIDIFGVKADLTELWAQAAQTNVEGQIASAAPATVQDAISAVEMATKGGTYELQRLVERKIQALAFTLGYGGYYGPAIKTYFEALSGSSSLRVVIVNKKDGKLFGMYGVADLIGYLRAAGDSGYQRFQELLNSGSSSAMDELARLPGFVGADKAITAATSKRDALARMEELNVDMLPVTDEKAAFVGTVERAKLTASMILTITDKIETRKEAEETKSPLNPARFF